MKSTVAVLIVALLACATVADARSRKKPKPPVYPVTKVVASYYRETRVLTLDENSRSVWFAFYATKPLVMHPDNTVRVIHTHFSAYMDEPLCQAMPTMYLDLGASRWGRALYENLDGYRYRMLQDVRRLVNENCAPDTVKTIKVAGFKQGLASKHFDRQFLDHFDGEMANQVGLSVARYVYFGFIDTRGEYTLVHHDPDGLARYLRTNRNVEATAARIQAIEQAEADLRREGIGGIVKDYCQSVPEACLGILDVITRGGSGTSSSSPSFAQCMSACQIRGPESLGSCQSRCYEFVAK